MLWLIEYGAMKRILFGILPNRVANKEKIDP